jgi:hypothetical protein
MIWKIDHAVKAEGAVANPPIALPSTDFNKPSPSNARRNFFSAAITIRAWSNFKRLAH